MTVKENLNRILKETQNYKPKIIAVTKYYGTDKMIEAYNAGLRDFAESRAKESIEKINRIDDTIKSCSSYHFIGHLQTNKAKQVVGIFDYIHSVDSVKLAQCIDLEASKINKKQKILLQINNAQEEQKYGLDPSQIENTIEEVNKLNSVELIGLMNIAPFTDDTNELHRLFSQMRKLKEQFGLKELSMGMSHDYKIALEEGATMLRLGRILFE